MPRVALAIGVLLTLLGVAGYLIGLAGDYASWTALIPAFAGVPILLCGLIGSTGDAARKHAMHFAALIALLGAIAPLGRLPTTLTGDPVNWVAATSLIGMLVLCALFVALAVRSFVAARRARQRGAGTVNPLRTDA